MNDEGYYFVTSAGNRIERCKVLTTHKDGNGNMHALCKFLVIQTGKNMKKRSRVQNCKHCSKETTFFCFECQHAYCNCMSDKGHGRKCFIDHFPSRSSTRFLS